MKFPQTNKIKNKKKDPEEKLHDNAKHLEEQLKKIDTDFMFRVYLKGLGLICLTIFALLSTIKLVFLFFDIFYLWL